MANALPDDKAYLLVSTVGTNMDRLRQAVNALRQLHDRWEDDTNTCINLIAQLAALKSCLGKVYDWLNYAISELHPQLLSDLEVLMTSCTLLIRHTDRLVQGLRQPGHDAIDCAVRLKYAIGSRTMERLREAALRQTDAMNLLHAACQCHATAQRKILLHKSRQVRKEDNLSLKALARSSRWNGGCLVVLTHMSRVIQYVKFVFCMKLLHQHDPNQEPTEKDYESAAAAIRSKAIDRALQEDATTLRRETKIVLMGQNDSGKELIMHQVKVLYADGYYSVEDRMRYQGTVRSTFRLLIHAIIDLLKDTGINLSQEMNEDFAVLLDEVESVDMQRITPAAVRAVERIWSSEEFSTLYIKNFEIDFPQYTPYFVQEKERIADEDYVPIEADIIRLNQAPGGIKELRFNWDELDVHLFNINGHVPDQLRKRWLHQFDDATSLVYTVDVSLYDRPFYGQSSKSQLLDDFANFESWVTSPKFANSSIILLLNNFTRFRDKLPFSPLSTFFPDFSPSATDPENSARNYILQRFKDANRNGLAIYSFWVDLDLSNNTHLYAALKKTLQHIVQRRARNEVWHESNTTIDENEGGFKGLLARSCSHGKLLGRTQSRREVSFAKVSTIDSVETI